MSTIKFDNLIYVQLITHILTESFHSIGDVEFEIHVLFQYELTIIIFSQG